MKELFGTIGVILRLPFYLIGLALVTVVAVPFSLLGSLLGVVAIPWVFLKSAFLNRPEVLQEHIKESVGLDFGGWYADLWRWLLEGSR